MKQADAKQAALEPVDGCATELTEARGTAIVCESTMFRYTAYGLHVSSVLEIPPLTVGEAGPADVTIQLGPIAEALDQPLLRGVCYEAVRGELLLHLPGIARYLVRDGSEITIDRVPEAQDDAVRLFLLNVVLGALLQQRGLLVLHGSAVATEDGAILFVGPSASGKSTLAGEFLRRGYRVLADELCAIVAAPDGPRLWPANPHLQLWGNVLDRLGLAPAKRWSRVRAGLEKYYVPVEQFSTASVPVVAVNSLHTSNTGELARTPLKGIAKFKELTENLFQPRFAKGMRMLQQSFEQIQGLAQTVRLARLDRPRSSFLLRELADLVENGRS